MIFDVMFIEGYNKEGKQIIEVGRIHDTKLSKHLRYLQDSKKYIVSVIPLFKPKMKDVVQKYIADKNEIDPDYVDGM